MKNRFIEILKMIKFKIINKRFFTRKNKLILSKVNNCNNVSIELSPHLIKASKVNDIELLCDKVKNFLIVMERDCKNFDSTIFEINFKQILFNIKGLQNDLFNRRSGWVSSNHLKLLELGINDIESIYHELLHISMMTSSINKKYEFYNEGYTELLTQRYFNSGPRTYPAETLVLSNIELILGKDYLEEKSFKGELVNTITELSKYTSYENITNFIDKMNIIFSIEQTNFISEKEKVEKYAESLSAVLEILFSCLKIKINNTSNLFEKMEYLLKCSMFGTLELANPITKQRLTVNLLSFDKFKELQKLVCGDVTLNSIKSI